MFRVKVGMQVNTYPVFFVIIELEPTQMDVGRKGNPIISWHGPKVNVMFVGTPV